MLKDPVLRDLDVSLKELAATYPALPDDRLFSAWFVHAYITEDLNEAVSAVTGEAGDKNADAVVVDKETKTVSIIQTKYRKRLLGTTEKANELYGFASLAEHIYRDSDEEFNLFVKTAAPHVVAKLRSARGYLFQDGWTLSLLYVTLGKATGSVIEQAEQRVRKASKNAAFEFIDGDRLVLLLRDYLDGAAPPVSSVELSVESGDGIVVKSAMNRFDSHDSIETWVFPVKGSDIGRLFEKHGRRIFARNVRGFMGEKTAVNKEMVETINKHPDRFFYLNNGLTVVCDAAEKTEMDGREIIRIANPQIINGQQTTRSLASAIKAAEKTSVVVRVIRIPRRVDEDLDKFETLVTKIVQGTNWQNAITQADLMSNDRRQIQLERALRSKGYIYLRKREKKGDAHKNGFGGKFTIKKEELARAVAGCTLDPALVRAGIDNLFSEERYSSVFPNSQLGYFLPKYWVMRAVNREIQGEPRLGYMKWLVMNFVWSEIRHLLGKASEQRQFWEACQDYYSEIHQPLGRLSRRVFMAVDAFYKENKRTINNDGNKVVQDESNFFKSRRGLPAEFHKFWKGGRCSLGRKRAKKDLSKIGNILEAVG